ncbi:hypothetical protein MTBLM1_10052 [Rhodospirillaceae bacterium LM-1]|nr:hypothetical protein MTBLM1_10052 [Rhodospirillaceae bacterium LM-1]
MGVFGFCWKGQGEKGEDQGGFAHGVPDTWKSWHLQGSAVLFGARAAARDHNIMHTPMRGWGVCKPRRANYPLPVQE